MAKKVNSEKQKHKEDRGALFIPACLFLGMGFGFTIDNFVAGLFFGLGLGFLLFAIVNLLKKNK
jgi:hypothetical protein